MYVLPESAQAASGPDEKRVFCLMARAVGSRLMNGTTFDTGPDEE
jgi:hypothetical protein